MKNENLLNSCTFAILGDSYSTFEGYIPEGNAYYYPRPEAVDDVLRVEDTWWHLLMSRNNMKLLRNDSYSGATVCTDVRPGLPFSSAFTERAKPLFSDEQTPDYIFLFGCTNDSWLNRSVGEVKFSDQTEADLRQVLPAYCFCLEQLTAHNPQTKIFAVINTDLKPEITAGMHVAAEHYGATVVALKDIDKQNGHPSALGMRQIAEQIEAAF